ncbi:hypothetical protein AB0D10_40160 [Kitasatospora sp. NPDC048545]|uniref:hypothetical protein n=1 Tax=Kitasatospora sp. NPDC048545 TaxID=3157208 RepID=UPI0033FA6481
MVTPPTVPSPRPDSPARSDGYGPVLGRIADRHGQRTVGLAAALVDAAALITLVVVSERGLPLGWQVVPAALTGLSVPLVGPLSRSRWVRPADGDPEPTSAVLSLDGIVDEVPFTTGPALFRARGEAPLRTTGRAVPRFPFSL